MDITTIPIEVFLGHLPFSVDRAANVQLQEKARWLAQTFPCFQESLTENKKWQRPNNPAKPNHPVRPMEKPRIGNRDLSNENLARKDFVSHMNKLSTANKQAIFKHIQQTLRPGFLPQYIQWLWEYMLQSPAYQDLYLEVIPMVTALEGPQRTQDILRDMWTAYCTEQKWIPSADVFEEEYDDFCNYLLWKKKAIASIQAWIRLGRTQYMSKNTARDLFTYLLHSCSQHMTQPSKTLEVLLEQVLQYLALQKPDVLELHTWMDQWRPSFATMPPAIRFKLYDMEEWMQGKNEKIQKSRK